MRIQFTPKGECSELGKILTQAVRNVDKIGTELVDSNAKMYKDALIDNIEGQKLQLKPLTPNYKRWKGIMGLDTRILIATGEYLSNIDIRELPNKSSKLRYHVGIDQNATHSGGINMGLLALVMEYGTADGRIPARPHFAPTWEQVRPRVLSNCGKFGARIWNMMRNKK